MKRLNALNKGQEVAMILPMDGFHYYKKQLDDMPDPQHAHVKARLYIDSYFLS